MAEIDPTADARDEVINWLKENGMHDILDNTEHSESLNNTKVDISESNNTGIIKTLAGL